MNERKKPDKELIVIATAYDKTCGTQIIDMAKVPFSTDGDETSYLDWLNENQIFAVTPGNGSGEIRPVTVSVPDDPRRGPLIGLGENTVELVSYRGKLLARREPWEEAEGFLQQWIQANRQRRLEVSRVSEPEPKRRAPKKELPNPFDDIFGIYRYMKAGKYLNPLPLANKGLVNKGRARKISFPKP